MIILLLIFFFWVVGLPIGVDLSIELSRFTSLSNLPKPVKLPGWKFSAESDLFSGNGSDMTDFLLTTLLPPFSGCSASWLTPTLKVKKEHGPNLFFSKDFYIFQKMNEFVSKFWPKLLYRSKSKKNFVFLEDMKIRKFVFKFPDL